MGTKLSALLLAIGLSACGGVEEETQDDGERTLDVGEGVVRRLTAVEYKNTVRDLLGLEVDIESFPPDEETFGFDNNSSAQSVSPLLAETYMNTAEALAEAADVATRLPCTLDTPEPLACAADFIRDFGLQAYRRPLLDPEVEALLGVAQWGLDNADFETAMSLVIQGVLQSPNFLYRAEVGEEVEGRPDLFALTQFELASRLSYLIWGSMPDAELLAAAADHRLDREEMKSQARRLLADEKAKETIAHFYRQWLQLKEVDHLQKDRTIFPGFNSNVAKLLRIETETLIDHVVWDLDTDIREIFATSQTFRNGILSGFYGEAGPTGEEFLPMASDPSKRAGILSHGSILATHSKPNQSSPIHRGLFVREQLLCHIMPEPPDDFAIVPPELDPNLSTRERFRQHREDDACAGCHAILDPIGFGFEHFDGVGRYRAQENGEPIDASGELTVTDVDGPFLGAPGLAEKLSKSEDVQNCVVSQAFRFAYGRGESENDLQTLEDLRIAFAQQGGGLQQLFVELTQTDAFWYRKGSAASAQGDN